MADSSNPLPWYKEGLKFKCTGCGQCCTGAPGYVWVTIQEMEEMAQVLNISLAQFKRTYIRQRDNRYALIEKKNENNACIFLKNNRCQVYTARPSQCRTYPWWKENLNTKESWALAAEQCEGISDDAPRIPFDEIQKNLSE
ncbi:uncharacterized protein jhp_0259 [Parachlamydia acanthamoebae UV-7]|jgi:Fe-S-cluster containining protein|uniref:Uncharacterized protein jhp_0259 n=2 Tax=Parachlamydia acanthamoebae TaxID=83552 RepID=F8KWX7_PARAV|nr:YkgJ family cysteine cluster protein [Parachlamydia acanthamoebae]EFB41665.1 hypothetical protein pah_c026o108 [Parachlamydia acanthamoebae str. Hall's coccus]KIA77607.1 hypothetical protein DB43_GD00380 [Parachlamydia acanthamoebae]CCB86694.1 uncharacterized protein jhp_0259 [Parachlamydia acanthamoebae UV-7]